MKRFLKVVIFSVVLSSCYRKTVEIHDHLSPSGKNVLIVVEELLPANDPANWWLQVSVRETANKSPVVPGNLLSLQGRGDLHVEWQSEEEVTVKIPDEIWRENSIPTQKTLLGYQITFVRGE